ncbi:translation factor GUF1 homolog, chloroplastic isoform X2 [Herrania umbratica]|uniref:Translation factor GUF1 homolog, mitochondrial n=1 Tax=Herrania umbratica TaxID=108875 RepID=A0A6J1BL35_9ROSI|nr:translation factor GUF1 homolog, chloroplastic isoform X2 [Herrania umbratica]
MRRTESAIQNKLFSFLEVFNGQSPSPSKNATFLGFLSSKLVSKAARMRYMYANEPYCLNLIDTPGHVDFSYEVSRSLAACEGALLVVDASQGVEAQTLANVYLAVENNLEIISVLNKIDLPGAEPDRVIKEIEEVIGLDCSNALCCSAKEGIGITEILNAIVERIPPPHDAARSPLRALIFDSYYDPYRGVIVYFRVIDGTIRKGDRIYFMASKKDFFADEIGVLSPNQMQVEELYAGEVGYLSASIRSVADARVGDTITHYGRKAERSLPGYEKATPMVFCGLFPVDADHFSELRDALEKLQLNDAALKFEPETSSAMGFGFRCGFLGLLHMEIVQERLEREYNLSLITTAPSVVYRVNCINGDTVECSNPSLLPEPGQRRSIEEPFVKIEMLTPKDFIGSLMELAQDRRGEFKEMKFITENRASIIYELPLAEMVGDFFDQLKSRSKGYASMEYTFLGYKESELIKLDILINGDHVEPLSAIVHKDKAYSVGRALTQKLKELIPRQMFKVPIQACIGSKVIASESLSAIRKDVLAKCYGGDISRKKKLLKKQAEGKKRMKAIGKVDVPQEAFMAVLKLEKEVL